MGSDRLTSERLLLAIATAFPNHVALLTPSGSACSARIAVEESDDHCRRHAIPMHNCEIDDDGSPVRSPQHRPQAGATTRDGYRAQRGAGAPFDRRRTMGLPSLLVRAEGVDLPQERRSETAACLGCPLRRCRDTPCCLSGRGGGSSRVIGPCRQDLQRGTRFLSHRQARTTRRRTSVIG